MLFVCVCGGGGVVVIVSVCACGGKIYNIRCVCVCVHAAVKCRTLGMCVCGGNVTALCGVRYVHLYECVKHKRVT